LRRLGTKQTRELRIPKPGAVLSSERDRKRLRSRKKKKA